MACKLTIIRDGPVFKIFGDGQQVRIQMKNGNLLAVEFETRRAAEEFIRVHELLRALDELAEDG